MGLGEHAPPVTELDAPRAGDIAAVDSRGVDDRDSEHAGDRVDNRSLPRHAPTLHGGSEGGNPVMRRFWSWLAVELGKRAGLVALVGLILTMIFCFNLSPMTAVGGPLVIAVEFTSLILLLRDFGRVVAMNVAVALLSALVVPPLLVWAERRGWVSRGLIKEPAPFIETPCEHTGHGAETAAAAAET